MSNDLFKSMGLDDVEAPGKIADGKYPAFVYESQVIVAKSGKNQGKPSWVLNYKIAEGKFNGQTQSEWFSLDPNNETVKPWLKARILSLGVPETKVGSFEPSEAIGTPVWVTIQERNGYQNVTKVELRDEQVSMSSVPQTPSSSGGLL